MSPPIELPQLAMPPDLSHEQMPDLLRYWYLGPKPRRHMMLRRFAEVDARAAQLVGRGPARPRLLDIGSAWGFNVMAMDRLGFDVIGVDLVPDQFGVGQRIAEANGAAFPVAAADAARLPFRDGSFDAITMVETFEHIFLEDRPRALAECHRVLRPGGALVLSTPNYNSVVERFKRLTGRHPAVRRRLPTMCYPEEGTGRERYHPYRYHHPLPDGAIRSLLEAGGFEVEAVTHFLFMLKNTPGGIYPIARFLERLGESFAPLRRLSATSCFTARKS